MQALDTTIVSRALLWLVNRVLILWYEPIVSASRYLSFR